MLERIAEHFEVDGKVSGLWFGGVVLTAAGVASSPALVSAGLAISGAAGAIAFIKARSKAK